MDIIKFPGWRYGPHGEKQIFERAEDVPAGWEDNPNDFIVREGNLGGAAPEVAPLGEFDKAYAIETLKARGIKADGRWSDKRLQDALAAK